LEYSKALPCAFTEHGALLAASVLNSPRAVDMSVFVVRAFVKLRQSVLQHEALSRRLDEVERGWALTSARSWHWWKRSGA
jgi:hypothetical protein